MRKREQLEAAEQPEAPKCSATDTEKGNVAKNTEKSVRRPRSGSFTGPAKHLGFADLQNVYHLPRRTAAEALGLTVTFLKRLARKFVGRWPYRRFKCLAKLHRFTLTKDTAPVSDSMTNLEFVLAESEQVLEDPSYKLSKPLKTLRARSYKEAHKNKLQSPTMAVTLNCNQQLAAPMAVGTPGSQTSSSLFLSSPAPSPITILTRTLLPSPSLPILARLLQTEVQDDDDDEVSDLEDSDQEEEEEKESTQRDKETADKGLVKKKKKKKAEIVKGVEALAVGSISSPMLPSFPHTHSTPRGGDFNVVPMHGAPYPGLLQGMSKEPGVDWEGASGSPSSSCLPMVSFLPTTPTLPGLLGGAPAGAGYESAPRYNGGLPYGTTSFAPPYELPQMPRDFHPQPYLSSSELVRSQVPGRSSFPTQPPAWRANGLVNGGAAIIDGHCGGLATTHQCYHPTSPHSSYSPMPSAASLSPAAFEKGGGFLCAGSVSGHESELSDWLDELLVGVEDEGGVGKAGGDWGHEEVDQCWACREEKKEEEGVRAIFLEWGAL